MKNLLAKLKDLFDDKEKWDYYNLKNLPNPFILNKEYNNAKVFIKKFLEYSNKTKNIFDVLEKIEKKRNLHIVTNYFLGIYLYENNSFIKDLIDKQIKKYTLDDTIKSNNSFKYFWFLICFYHDVGYYYEKKLDINEYKSLKELKKHLRIQKNLDHFNGVPQLFQSVYKKYYKYRMNEFNVFDHGIVGGILFYDRLFKIYCYYKSKSNSSSETFEYHNLTWSKSMLKYFKLMASIILVHNIWFISENDKDYLEKYKNYDLNKLIISKSNRKISSTKYPFLFLLSLVDSIEPTKKYGLDFLNKIDLIFNNTSEISILSNSTNNHDVKKWFDSILALDDWLVIEMNRSNNSLIKINFKT